MVADSGLSAIVLRIIAKRRTARGVVPGPSTPSYALLSKGMLGHLIE